MNSTCNTSPLQLAYQSFMSMYAQHFEYALTLTLKQSIQHYCGNNVHKTTKTLDEAALQNTLRYFTCNLTRYLFGNSARHPNKQHFAKPLLIIAVEGLNSDKLVHLHMGLGNVPDAKNAHIDLIVGDAWKRCDFANEQICIKPITHAQGWMNYMTKEIGYNNDLAIDITASTIPAIFNTASVT